MVINVEVQEDTQERPTEEVHLGHEGPFIFTYPKMGRIMTANLRIKGLPKNEAEAIMADTMLTWLAKGFGPDAWAYIQGLVDNDDHPLDTEHLFDTFRLLVQAHAKRPSTSSSGASAQPWMKNGTDVPSAPESASETSTPESFATSSTSG